MGCPGGNGDLSGTPSDGGKPLDGAGPAGDAAGDLAGADRSVPDLAGADGRPGPDAPIGDAALGDASAPDLTVVDLKGPTCGNGSCALTQVCCLVPVDAGVAATCLGSCAFDGGSYYPGSCAAPSDCRAGVPCCVGSGDIPTADGGTVMAPASPTCTAPCPAYWSQTLNGQINSDESQLCGSATDCVGYSGTLVITGLGSFNGPFDDCCALRNGPPERVCVPSQAVQLLPAYFTCF